MFLITGISTFTWILLAYIGLHLGYGQIAEHVPAFKEAGYDQLLDAVVYKHYMSSGVFILKVKELFLIFGAIALFFEVAKAATTKSFSGVETLLSFVVAIIFVIMFFMVSWAGNATFLILMLMSFIDATGGFIIELNAAQRDFHIG